MNEPIPGLRVYKNADGLVVFDLEMSAHPQFGDAFITERKRGQTTAGWQTEYLKKWGVAPGSPVYKGFRRNWHVASRPIEPNTVMPFYVGLDFGLYPAILITQLNEYGQWIWLQEVQGGLSPSGKEVGEDIGSFYNRVIPALNPLYPVHKWTAIGDISGKQRSYTDGRSGYDFARKAGIKKLIPSPTQNTDARLAAVQQQLDRSFSGHPGMVLNPALTMAIAAFEGGYSLGVKEGSDKPIKNKYSHLMDCGQYAAVWMFNIKGEFIRTPERYNVKKIDRGGNRVVGGLSWPGL